MDNILVKTSTKRVLYFYGSKGLCFKDLIRLNSNPKVIFDTSCGDFDVVEMNNGEIGIICQDNEGSIVFLRESGNSYLKTTLLKNKNKIVYNKYFSLHRHGEWISALYIIDYEEKKILSHQIVDRENITPEAVDEISDCKFRSFTDKSGNILLVYQKDNEFGYRFYRWSVKKWSDYTVIAKGILSSAVVDFFDNLYVLYSENGNDYCVFMKVENFTLTETEKISIRGCCDSSVMFTEKEALWIVREEKDRLTGIKYTCDLKEASGPLLFGNDIYKKKYRIKTKENRYVINECFGYETNNVPKLILYKNLYNTSDIIPSKNIIEEGEEICDFAGISVKKEGREQIEINKLKLKISDLQRRISKLENTVNNK